MGGSGAPTSTYDQRHVCVSDTILHSHSFHCKCQSLIGLPLLSHNPETASNRLNKHIMCNFYGTNPGFILLIQDVILLIQHFPPLIQNQFDAIRFYIHFPSGLKGAHAGISHNAPRHHPLALGFPVPVACRCRKLHPCWLLT